MAGWMELANSVFVEITAPTWSVARQYVLKTAWMLWKCVAVKKRQFSLLFSFVSFKASAVRHGPQQPSGSEPCSLSTRLQQFWGGDSPGTPSDTRYVCPAALFIQLCWGLWPSALSGGAAQNAAPQHRLLHGMEKRTLRFVCNFPHLN